MDPEVFISTTQTVAAVVGENNKSGDGVFGIGHGATGRGVVGTSDDQNAVSGIAKKGNGVFGDSTDGIGVYGHSTNQHGVWGESDKGSGVTGIGHKWYGVYGQAEDQVGVFGQSTNGIGVQGHSINQHGVWGESDKGSGVTGIGHKWHGVFGQADDQVGVFGQSTSGRGVVGVSNGTATGVEGNSKDGIGVFGKGGHLAGRFEGDVEVTGDIRLTNADFAEDFDVVEKSEAGEVMVLTETGALQQSAKAYDKKVVGVISGAGSYKPGIILDKQNNSQNRKPIAMMGKVFCKVDADFSPIETGDMLTTSNIPGYAMKAIDPFKAFGAVIGKALASLKEGKGLIPILVVLQ